MDVNENTYHYLMSLYLYVQATYKINHFHGVLEKKTMGNKSK